MKSVWYWLTIYAALVCCIIYSAITAPKYGIRRWKMIVILLLAFVYNWGASYIASWVEAGFSIPPTVNAARTWVYCPLFFLAVSVLFNIDFRRLSDAITPSYTIGFAFGHVGCVFAGCCNGYPYDGHLAIWNPRLCYYCFPTQLVESGACLILTIIMITYACKTKFKITGRMYPWMLVAYTARVGFEFLRDNEKLFGRVSTLMFHALLGGIAGAIWLYFTTASGKRMAARLRNVGRRLVRKEPLPVLSKAEYAAQITETQRQLSSSSYNRPANENGYSLIETSQSDFVAECRRIRRRLVSLSVAAIVLLGMIAFWLQQWTHKPMELFLGIFFLILTTAVAGYAIYSLRCVVRGAKEFATGKSKGQFINDPIRHRVLLIKKKAGSLVEPSNCPICGRKLEARTLRSDCMSLTCLGGKKHTISVPAEID